MPSRTTIISVQTIVTAAAAKVSGRSRCAESSEMEINRHEGWRRCSSAPPSAKISAAIMLAIWKRLLCWSHAGASMSPARSPARAAATASVGSSVPTTASHKASVERRIRLPGTRSIT
jgi:hypothetical protein